MAKANLHIYVVAAEKSGDELGAKLVTALQEQSGNKLKFSAIGGSALAAKGLQSPVDISPLSILGFTEGIKVYPIVLERVRQTAEAIIKSGAGFAVLIDSWGFMIRVAKTLKKQGFKGKIIKYVAPQVWAMRAGRSRILATYVDHLLTIHNFDAPYFTRHGLDTHFVGNPVFDEAYDTGDEDQLRRDYNIPDDAPILAVFFGSRLSEIQKLAAPFADAVSILRQKIPELTIVSPVSDSISTDVHAAASRYPALNDVILLGEDRKLDCFAAADAAIACSGTVTTQLASAGVPTVVAYKLNHLTAIPAWFLFKPDHISMVNIAADAPLMPEFLQGKVNGDTLAKTALTYLTSSAERDMARNALLQAIDRMRSGNTGVNSNLSSSHRAAKAVLDIISLP